ncbi:MAG: HAD-IIIA family hydrolase [Rhizobiales bacterium]|nr:HAD-IIIA family hydrolase [Hyphomicrobiales bacterium]
MRLPNGIWVSTATPRQSPGKPALILDRDGVLVEEVHYLREPADVVLAPGATGIIHWARSLDMVVACATNQSGIARGLISWSAFEDVEAEISRQLATENCTLDLTVACPFHPDFPGPQAKEEEKWRKPGPAMLTLIASETGAELSASWMIGDKASDIDAARKAGLRGAIHLETGHGRDERDAALKLQTEHFDVFAAPDLLGARQILEFRITHTGK